MTHQMIYPELGEKTDAEIEFSCAYGGKFYVTTDLELKGRGIKLNGDGSNHARNKKTYFVTEKAMDKLKQQYSCCSIALL